MRNAWNKGTKGLCKPNKGTWRKGQIAWNKGIPMKSESKEKIRQANLGRKDSEEVKRKRVESRKWYKHSLETKNKISQSHKGKNYGNIGERSPNYKAYKRIIQEIPELEKKGFKCIPITKVVPDIIAMKDGRLYAIEVEYHNPNYEKYNKDNYRKYFEDIIWIIRK